MRSSSRRSGGGRSFSKELARAESYALALAGTPGRRILRTRGTQQGPTPPFQRYQTPYTIQIGVPGAAVVGTAALAVPFPPAHEWYAGCLFLIGVVNKYPPTTPATPVGWNLLAQVQGGAGAAGDDSGQVFTTVYWRVSTGGEAGSVPLVLTGATLSAARMYVVRGQSSGTGFLVSAVTGSKNSGGTAFSLTTGATSFVPTPGDAIMVFLGLNTDGPTYTVPALALPSSGIATMIGALAVDNNTSSPYCQLVSSVWQVTRDSSAVGASTFSMTASIADPTRFPAGSGVFCFIRSA